MAHCPGVAHANGDQNPSLSIRETVDGAVLLHCFVGCSVKKIVASLGIELRDLMPDSAVRVVPKAKKPTIYPTPQAAAAETATWLKVKNVGEKALGEIAELLRREGLNFGMQLEETAGGDIHVVDPGSAPLAQLTGTEEE